MYSTNSFLLMQVTYTVTSFLDKNRDSISEDLLDLIKASQDPFIAGMFEVEAPANEKSGAKQQSASTFFKNQLTSLITVLSGTHSQYVRCIKPNFAQLALAFDDPMVISKSYTLQTVD